MKTNDPTTSEREARELLAREYERGNLLDTAERIRSNDPLPAGWQDDCIAIRAIIAALTRQEAQQEAQGAVATLPVDVRGEWFDVPIPVQVHVTSLRMQLERDFAGVPAFRQLYDHMQHCVSAADEGEDYATTRPVLDAMTTLGLMEKVGRGKWAPTEAGEKLAALEAPTPPAPVDVREAFAVGNDTATMYFATRELAEQAVSAAGAAAGMSIVRISILGALLDGQPAGVVIDDAMVERAALAYEAEVEGNVHSPEVPRIAMRAALHAALGGGGGRDG